MGEHFSDTRELVKCDKPSDSFAKHFATHFNENENEGITRGDARNITENEILWQGKPIPSVKTFKKLNCDLCSRERMEIHKAMKIDKRNNANFLINSLNEVCGACGHNPKFHGHCSVTPKSADDIIVQKMSTNKENF